METEDEYDDDDIDYGAWSPDEIFYQSEPHWWDRLPKGLITAFWLVVGLLLFFGIMLFSVYMNWKWIILVLFLFAIVASEGIESLPLAIISLFGLTFIFVALFFYFSSLFVDVLVIEDQDSYTWKRMFKGSEYEYEDPQKQKHCIIIDGFYLHNNSSKTLRLYEASKYIWIGNLRGRYNYHENKGKNCETTHQLILPHTIVKTIRPSYILKKPPLVLSYEKPKTAVEYLDNDL